MVKKLLSMLLIVFFTLQCVVGTIPTTYVAQAASSTSTSKVALKITKQPKSATAPKGVKAKVTIKASGSGLEYNWYYKDSGAKKYTRATSFKSNSYSVKMSSSNKGRKVYCLVKDKYGKSVKSNVVTLKLGKTLKITTQPKSVKKPSGMTAKVTIKASGDGLEYTWYYKNANAKKYTKATSFKSTGYSVKMSSSTKGRKVYCVVKDKYGISVKSKVVTLNLGKTLKISKQPQSVKMPSGMTAKVSFTASGDGLTYKWYYKDKNASEFSLTKSFKSNSYSVEMSSANAGRQVYCVVEDQYGNTVKTNTVTLNLGKTLKISKQPASVKVPSEMTAKVSLTASGDGLTYKWYYKDKSASEFTLTESFKGNSYSIKMSESRGGRQVYCVVEDQYGKTVKTNTVTLQLGKTLSILQQPSSVKVPIGSDAKVSLFASGDGLSYKWYEKDKDATEFTLSDVFTGNYYAIEMTESRGDRQVYCVVKDQYGKTLQSDTVTLNLGKTLTITNQPVSVTAHSGYTADVAFTADGDGLSYKWYYKDKEGSEFYLIEDFTSNSYSIEMNEAVNGREVYCIVKDQYGKTLQTDTVTLNMNHEMGEWQVYTQVTAEREGVERSYCAKCSYYKDRTVPKLEALYFITVDLGYDEPYKVGVGENGLYFIETQKNPGYNFMGWEDSEGNSFNGEGTTFKDVAIKAVWELDGTDTLEELIERTNAGTDKINITSDIVLDTPLFISYNTAIYSDGDYSITRDPDFNGDMFVVGQDKDGVPAVDNQREAVLTLGGGEGTLTIDGNRDNLNVDVVGSALYVCEASTLNIHDGTRIANHHKIGNERIKEAEDYTSKMYAVERAGGAAVLNLHATVNMYGGVMENNKVYTEYTPVINEEGIEEKRPDNACGGSVYNRGAFNMYGGTISTSEALRGGGMYNDFVAYLYAGSISDNVTHTYGGGISSSSGANAEMYIGSEEVSDKKMIFSGNHSMNQGGALYSNTSSPIVIYGNTEFIENTADSSGGAIHTAGPLTIRGAKFIGNTTPGSGGSIYHHYTKADFERRQLTLENCTFENNQAKLGGAVILSATGTASEAGVGTFGTITNCNFTGNSVSGSGSSGGALYITKQSEAVVTGCTFTENTSAGNAGAVAAQSETDVTLSDSTFQGNTAANGGAFYTSGSPVLDLSNLTFTENEANLGGAMYVADASVTVNNIDFLNNTATKHGGAVYVVANTLTFDKDSRFTGNSAGQHGGAVYLTYKTVTTEATETEEATETKVGAVLNATDVTFDGNSAMAGGVISARTNCSANLDGAKLINNSVEGYDGENDGDGDGGGAIYVGYGEITLTNVTATDNTASDFGGVIDAVGSTVTITGGSYSANKTNSGGVIYARSNSIVTISGATISANESVYVQGGTFNSSIGGGAINMSGGELTVKNTTLSGNKTGYYGGATLTSKTKVNIGENSVVTGSTGATGAALYFKGSSTVTIADTDIINNTSTANGVIYQNGGTLDMTNVTATENSAVSGGVLFASGASTKITLDGSAWNNNTATTGGAIHHTNATVTISNTEISNNSANNGGAIYSKTATLEINDSTYTKNSATSGSGGAINLIGSKATISGDTKFTENTASNHAGAIYLTYTTDKEVDPPVTHVSVLDADGATFQGNSAIGGGAVSIRSDCEATIKNSTFTGNIAEGDDGTADGYGENGGAIYVGFGKLTLENVTANGNTSTKYGGAVHIIESTATITGGSFANNKGGNGGAVYVSENSTVSIAQASFQNNEGTNGGAIHLSEGSTSTLTDLTFTENTATGGGGAIYINYTAVTPTNLDFIGNTATNNGGAIYLNGTTLNVDSAWEFTGNSAGKHGGAVYLTYKTVKTEATETEEATETKVGAVLNATDVTFDGNSALAGGALSARTNCSINLNGTKLTNNSVTGFVDDGKEDTVDNDGDGEGGGAIYVGFGEATLTDVTATGNTASDFGGVVDSVTSTVTITGGTYSNNSANNGGVLHAMSKSSITLEGVTMNSNTSPDENTGFDSTIGGGAIHTVGGTLDITGSTFDGNTSGNYGGAVHTNGTAVTINGNSTITNTSGATGAALYFRGGNTTTLENITISNNTSTSNGVLYKNGGTLTMSNVSATGNAATQGGVLFISGGSTTATLADSTWKNNTANSGGALYMDSASVTLTNSELSENTAIIGGAVYNKLGELEIDGMTFANNAANLNDGGDGGAITLAAGTMTTAGNNTFSGNTAADHGGAIYVVYVTNTDDSKSGGTLTMAGDLLENNTATSGGAISARTNSVVNLTGTQLKGNTATSTSTSGTGGGAIFANDGTTTLSGVILDGNSSGYYGGAIVALNTIDFTVKDNSQITNNTATTGAAIDFRGSGPKILTDVSMTDNVSTKGSGVLYNTGSGTLDVTRLTASGNKNNNGGVLYHSGSGAVTVTDSSFTSNTAVGLGGAIDHRGSGTLTVTGTTISGNTAKNGGAINASGAGKLIVKSSEINENSATVSGGAIHATGNGNVEVSDGTTINTNTAPLGGAVVVDTGATVTIDGVTMDGNSAGTGEGGAILIADTSDEGTATTTLNLTNTTLSNNVAETQGGAISTDGTSPNLVINANGCTFSGNTATTKGAGAVEIKNANCNSETDPTEVKIVFTNCTFTGNKSLKATGGAVEVRTGSCAKFDGITATDNTAKQNGGAIYATSLHSRVYLTGEVTQSGNTSTGGTFIHLYHDGKYTNPPKLYTTHSSTADWCSNVGGTNGNETNIAFDLTELP